MTVTMQFANEDLFVKPGMHSSSAHPLPLHLLLPPTHSALTTARAGTSTTTPGTSAATPLPAWALKSDEVSRPVSKLWPRLRDPALPKDGWMNVGDYYLRCAGRCMKEPQLHVLPELEGLLLFAKEGPVLSTVQGQLQV